MSDQQREELAYLLARHGIPQTGRLPVLSAAPTVLEIGFGMGEATLAFARADPLTAIIAIEVHTPGVLRLLRAIDADALTNVSVAHDDAIELVRHRVTPASLAGIRVFFPDPWPKTRHHKRRIIQPATVTLLATRLVPGGFLHLATDVPGYAQQMRTVLAAEPLLRNDFSGFAPESVGRPETRFERQARGAGRAAYDLVFHRRRPDEA